MNEAAGLKRKIAGPTISSTVAMRAIGGSVGFSFGKDLRFMTKPTERWQKLEIQVGAGDTIQYRTQRRHHLSNR